ncbi:hypothetical protein [Mangrovicoccus ximenensis]|uniref:hypothetical protein n=1 Tax=Mangrovicoccus ximenensis TaxID=1911570 RepID=UPI0011AE667E|nr:hypothetical protein [Mangrovicoccus ximenensis]
MTPILRSLTAGLLLVLAAGCGGPPASPVPTGPVSASNLSGILGMSYSPAIDQVRALGYRQVRSRGATSYWQEPRSGRCTRIGRARGRRDPPGGAQRAASPCFGPGSAWELDRAPCISSHPRRIGSPRDGQSRILARFPASVRSAWRPERRSSAAVRASHSAIVPEPMANKAPLPVARAGSGLSAPDTDQVARQVVAAAGRLNSVPWLQRRLGMGLLL